MVVISAPEKGGAVLTPRAAPRPGSTFAARRAGIHDATPATTTSTTAAPRKLNTYLTTLEGVAAQIDRVENVHRIGVPNLALGFRSDHVAFCTLWVP